MDLYTSVQESKSYSGVKSAPLKRMVWSFISRKDNPIISKHILLVFRLLPEVSVCLPSLHMIETYCSISCKPRITIVFHLL